MEKEKFYRKKWFAILMLLFFAPIGIALIWKYGHFKQKTNVILSVLAAVFFTFILIDGQSNETEEAEAEVATEKTEEKKQEVAKVEEEPELSKEEEAAAIEAKKIEDEVAKKEEEEAAKKQKAEVAKKEKEAKAEADKKAKTAEKDHYTNEVLPKINDLISVYDKIWTDVWQPTFEGLGTTVDVYTAYQNMGEVMSRYAALEKQISSLDGDGLSKENKELLDGFKSEFLNAATHRRTAGKQAQKMIDAGTFAPSELDKVMTTVGYSDSSSMMALVSKVSLDMAYGIEE